MKQSELISIVTENIIKEIAPVIKEYIDKRIETAKQSIIKEVRSQKGNIIPHASKSSNFDVRSLFDSDDKIPIPTIFGESVNNNTTEPMIDISMLKEETNNNNGITFDMLNEKIEEVKMTPFIPGKAANDILSSALNRDFSSMID